MENGKSVAGTSFGDMCPTSFNIFFLNFKSIFSLVEVKKEEEEKEDYENSEKKNFVVHHGYADCNHNRIRACGL